MKEGPCSRQILWLSPQLYSKVKSKPGVAELQTLRGPVADLEEMGDPIGFAVVVTYVDHLL